MIASVYNEQYGVVFSEDVYDLDNKIEPWPHRYLIGSLDGDVVAVCGMYMRSTYVERYGLVTGEDIVAALREAGVDGRYDPSNRREITKLVVARRFRNRKITPSWRARSRGGSPRWRPSVRRSSPSAPSARCGA
jgi:hypothetical protein